MDATSRPTPTPTSAAADGGLSKKRMPLVERRRTSPVLAAYVAATIVAGVAALAWATLTLPLGPDIATDGLTHIAADDRVSGLLFWIAFGLLGSARTKGYGGHAVLTFHLPFIVAAMALGGPVAGGWVAAIASIELRELREVPWFGTLSNHAIVTLAAVIGGLVVAALRGILGPALDSSLATLAAAADPPATIPVGVTIGGVAVGGMAPEVATTVVQQAFQTPLELKLATTQVLVAPDVLGAVPVVDKAIERALAAPPNTAIPLPALVEQPPCGSGPLTVSPVIVTAVAGLLTSTTLPPDGVLAGALMVAFPLPPSVRFFVTVTCSS